MTSKSSSSSSSSSLTHTSYIPLGTLLWGVVRYGGGGTRGSERALQHSLAHYQNNFLPSGSRQLLHRHTSDTRNASYAAVVVFVVVVS
ncbi:hypothetical protein E2C01_054215 [Portunus trituberculatus]|uniref:Uncharacterized protein n=1 Tax=Portunus trituberculatus TaxID=210409 RepID=A0A5B7GT51_PORTR|nr:hypothetical protein [Portunus trituberculatus]